MVFFALQKLLTFFFSKKFQYICVSLYVNFNESLTNDIVSFEQLGPGWLNQFCFFFFLFSGKPSSLVLLRHMYIDHVGVGFYGHECRVTGFFRKLGNVHCGRYLDGRP